MNFSLKCLMGACLLESMCNSKSKFGPKQSSILQKRKKEEILVYDCRPFKVIKILLQEIPSKKAKSFVGFLDEAGAQFLHSLEKVKTCLWHQNTVAFYLQMHPIFCNGSNDSVM